MGCWMCGDRYCHCRCWKLGQSRWCYGYWKEEIQAVIHWKTSPSVIHQNCWMEILISSCHEQVWWSQCSQKTLHESTWTAHSWFHFYTNNNYTLNLDFMKNQIYLFIFVLIFLATMFATLRRVTIPEAGLSNPVSTWSNIDRASILAATIITELSSSGAASLGLGFTK